MRAMNPQGFCNKCGLVVLKLRSCLNHKDAPKRKSESSFLVCNTFASFIASFPKWLGNLIKRTISSYILYFVHLDLIC